MTKLLSYLTLLMTFSLTALRAEPFALPEVPIMVMETNYGTIELLLYPKEAPKACENFMRLAQKGSYRNVPFHRVIPGFMIQGGDFTHHNGYGGQSIWKKPFKDEFASTRIFDRPGLLAMANAGPNTNESQFFITTVPTPWLNNVHTLFGEVISGYETVTAIEALGTPSGSIRKGTNFWGQGTPIDPPVILNLYLKPIFICGTTTETKNR